MKFGSHGRPPQIIRAPVGPTTCDPRRGVLEGPHLHHLEAGAAPFGTRRRGSDLRDQGRPRVTERYAAEPHANVDQTRRWVEDRLAGYIRRDSIFWVCALRGEERAIGSCCYWHFDERSRCAELGYELNRAYWHRGITSEALVPVLRYGFDGMGLHRIEACPFSENAPSSRLLQSLGFKLEGTLRQRLQFRGRFVDQLYYSLLEGEFDPPSGASP